jgi:5'-deoxynucleotidase YfbR-like HD superfamily hydrolase
MSKPVNEVIFGNLGRLRDTYRYSAQPVLVRENVAEHSFWTAMIGMVIAYEVEPSIVEIVVLKGLVHDIEECMTGDLVRDMKYATEDFREKVKEIERTFLLNLLVDMGEPGQQIFKEWEQAKNDHLAGRIVSLADALSVISYCTREYEMGNTKLLDIRNACANLIVEKFYDDLNLGDVAESAVEESLGRWPRAGS